MTPKLHYITNWQGYINIVLLGKVKQRFETNMVTIIVTNIGTYIIKTTPIISLYIFLLS